MQDAAVQDAAVQDAAVRASAARDEVERDRRGEPVEMEAEEMRTGQMRKPSGWELLRCRIRRTRSFCDDLGQTFYLYFYLCFLFKTTFTSFSCIHNSTGQGFLPQAQSM